MDNNILQDKINDNILQDINCTICGKLICKRHNWANTKGILFWCPRCKKNFELNKNSAPVANDR